MYDADVIGGWTADVKSSRVLWLLHCKLFLRHMVYQYSLKYEALATSGTSPKLIVRVKAVYLSLKGVGTASKVIEGSQSSFHYLHTPSIMKCRALSWNVGHFKVFRTDYGCVEKTFLPLIIMQWDSIWVIKYMLIKVSYPFPIHLPHMHLPLHGCMHIFLLRKTRKRCTIKMIGSTFNLECLIFEDKFWILKCPTFQDRGSRCGRY